MKVKAKGLKSSFGWIGGHRVYEGDEFECSESEFSSRWMIKLDAEVKAETEEAEVVEKPKRKRRTKAEIEADATQTEESSDTDSE